MPSGWGYKGVNWRDAVFVRDAVQWGGKPLVTRNASGVPQTFVIIDPYTGKLLEKRSQADTEHLVSLKWAWDRGANCWTQELREAFAHDPENLFAADKYANRTKGAGLLFEGLPPNLANCEWFINKVKAVTRKYSLTLRQSDKRVAEHALPVCKRHQKWIKLKLVRNWYGKIIGGRLD